MKVLFLEGYSKDGWISIGRYQRELMRHLAALDREIPLDLSSVTPEPGPLANRLADAGPIGRRLASYWSRFWVYPRRIRRSKADVYHLVDQSLSYLVRYLDAARTVVTCHDLLHFPLRRQFKRQAAIPFLEDSLYRLCVAGLPKCRAIIAVSECNKRDAIRYLNCKPERIRVVYEAASPVFFRPPEPDRVAALRRLFKIPDHTLLIHVGVCALYKNLEGLIRSLAPLKRRLGRPFTLIRVGPALLSPQRRLAQKLGVADLIREVGVHGDDTLPSWYRMADCLIFPSLYEGFGLPPLEAMACGTPVVSSPRGSLPEILGEAALWVDPEDPAEIASGIRKILEDQPLREDLRRRGLARAQQFSWEKNARETLAVYRSLT